jgi:integrase
MLRAAVDDGLIVTNPAEKLDANFALPPQKQQKANLPLHLTPHCLQHTYASLMLQQGEPVAYVHRQLRHASIQLTVDTYGKWLPMESQAAVDRLDAQILESGSNGQGGNC